MRVSGNIVDLFQGRIFPGTVEVAEGRIVSITKEKTSNGTFILPGFIDAHCHIESSLLCPSEFARIAVVHGTVATISDPHEIANVLGLEGVYFMMNNGRQVPFYFYFGAPSCVPATPFETAGAVLGIEETALLLGDPEIKYLGEMMNYPGVINADPTVMGKIAIAKSLDKPIDGHAPGLIGDALKAYIKAGISTDHETFKYEEGEEKLHLGMKIIIREGSAAKNFDTLFPLIEKYPDRCMFCSDDKHPDELVAGHINEMVKKAIHLGLDPIKVLRVACLNPVIHYNLDSGLLRKGDRADFIEVDSMENLHVLRTFIGGKIVAEEGVPRIDAINPACINRFAAKSTVPGDFAVKGRNDKIANIIEAISGQVTTGWLRVKLKAENGLFHSDPERDILKIALICRYAERPPVVAFVKNFGLKKGAIASSVSHDAHNIIAVGVRDEDLCRAVNLVIKNKGGLALVSDEIEEILPLPLAGLMSQGDGYRVAEKYASLDRMAKGLGSRLKAPFMTLSFMALPVIPRLKLTDRGLFNVEESKFIDIFE